MEFINPISKAFVPYINVKYEKVECHLLFATLPYSSIDGNIDICDESNLDYTHEEDVRSFGGYRTTEMILKLVKNIEEYRKTLKLLIEWASKRCIYSNKYGLFGPGSLSLLLCYVSELYPNSNSLYYFI